jgi:hypothetical protein
MNICDCGCVFTVPVYVVSGRNRWVKYTDSVGMDYDGSQVPAEW